MARGNWAFLDVDGAPRFRGRRSGRLGLPAQDAGICKTVDGFGDGRALRGLMHVGEHRHAELFPQLRRRWRAPCRARRRARSARWCGSPCRMRSCRPSPIPSRDAISLSAPAYRTHVRAFEAGTGPRPKASGNLLPKRTLPTVTMVFGFALIAGDHDSRATPGQPAAASHPEENAVGPQERTFDVGVIGPSLSLSSRA